MKWAQLLIFGSIGLVLFGFGLLWGIEAYTISGDTVSSKGTIVEFRLDDSGKKPDAVIPVVEFVSRVVGTVRFQAEAVSFDAPGYEKGAVVDVLYARNDPNNATIGSLGSFWIRPLFAIGVGLAVMLLSVVLFARLNRFEKALDALGSEKK